MATSVAISALYGDYRSGSAKIGFQDNRKRLPRDFINEIMMRRRGLKKDLVEPDVVEPPPRRDVVVIGRGRVL
jgi:hypothetical protein